MIHAMLRRLRRLPGGRGLRGLRRRAALGLALALGLEPATAQAWDPSTTHLGMVERSVLDSALHLRWMEASQLSRGLFSPLRLDPARLDDATLRTLKLALRQAHAASGAEALGGPGACPGASAPAPTRARCVDGDLWEMTALGWLELGVIVETVPAERLLHHFVDREDPSQPRWSDDDLPRSLLRLKHARAGGTLASRATGTSFEGSGRSALAWLDDPRDRWAPAALSRHLIAASEASSRSDRDHHLALAMLCTGVLLHVIQDLSVPAHARGDVSAMFLPLSPLPGDRGLPIQELARDAFGRGGLPAPVALAPRASERSRGIPRAPTLRGILLGHKDWEGLVVTAGRRFFSESSLPAAQRLDPAATPEAAAAALLDGARLHPQERDGAHLSRWPAERGYLVGGSGRPLAAFRRDEDQRVVLWLDRHVYQVQMRQLIPAGVDAGRSALDLLYAAWPPMQLDPKARRLEITPGPTWAAATLEVLLEDVDGRRSPASELVLQGEQPHQVVDAWPAALPEGGRVVLVLKNPPGTLPAIVETYVPLDDQGSAPSPPESRVPRPRAGRPKARTRAPDVPVRAGGTRPPADDATPPAGDTKSSPPPVEDAPSDRRPPAGDASESSDPPTGDAPDSPTTPRSDPEPPRAPPGDAPAADDPAPERP